jgi:hypothetical protein
MSNDIVCFVICGPSKIYFCVFVAMTIRIDYKHQNVVLINYVWLFKASLTTWL